MHQALGGRITAGSKQLSPSSPTPAKAPIARPPPLSSSVLVPASAFVLAAPCLEQQQQHRQQQGETSTSDSRVGGVGKVQRPFYQRPDYEPVLVEARVQHTYDNARRNFEDYLKVGGSFSFLCRAGHVTNEY